MLLLLYSLLQPFTPVTNFIANIILLHTSMNDFIIIRVLIFFCDFYIINANTFFFRCRKNTGLLMRKNNIPRTMHATEHSVITLIVKTDRFIFPCMSLVFFYRAKTFASLINKTNVAFHVACTYLELTPANTS